VGDDVGGKRTSEIRSLLSSGVLSHSISAGGHPRAEPAELTMVIGWCTRCDALNGHTSRVAKRPIKIRNEKRTKRI